MNVKLNVRGEILSGTYQGRYIKIIDENKLAGGFLLFIHGKDGDYEPIDLLINNYKDLLDYFVEFDLEVKWRYLSS